MKLNAYLMIFQSQNRCNNSNGAHAQLSSLSIIMDMNIEASHYP